MPRIHLVVGPVGAGKSTFTAELQKTHQAVVLNLDAWMATLFNPDRPEGDTIPWYLERVARCQEQIWKTTTAILDAGTDVVLEIGMIQRHARESFYAKVDAAALDLHIYVVDAPREVRWRRVQQRNRDQGSTFSVVVPESIFTMASDLWEPIDATEARDREVTFRPPE